MTSYSNSKWKEFRKNVIDSDGGKCTVCGKSSHEAILQVHHTKYISGRLPWEYAPESCVTLCKGCHAAEHGIIMPKFGWQYLGDEDLGDVIGTCEYCHTPFRYEFLIYHENWGTIVVGTLCCDNLTDSHIASNKKESVNKYNGRKSRFLKSNRWRIENGVMKIKQSLFDVEIGSVKDGYCLTIHKLKSKKVYTTLNEAKTAAFDAIETGKLLEYLKKNNITYGRTF